MNWSWLLRGFFAGIRTERIRDGDVGLGLSPGLPVTTKFISARDAEDVASRCPTLALEAVSADVTAQTGRCVQCMRCARGDRVQNWRHDTHWATAMGKAEALPKMFLHSIHVRIVDAGDCGACLNELAQLNGPLYNLHRFGIFLTPTPRQADVLLVVGPVTTHMASPLRAAYDAMPEPKRVVAVGACAVSGGIFGPSAMAGSGAAGAVPVDLVVPGCPPPPLAIIDALRSLCGQVA